MNASAVARRYGIKPAQLYRWKKSLSPQKALPIDQPELGIPEALAALNSEVSILPPIIEIRLVNGRSLRVHSATDPSSISRLVAALES